MKHTQNEIINALKVIQDVCNERQGDEPCIDCPLSLGNTCMVQDQAPADWKIKGSPPVWKAFK